jgi:hypothetical protein
VLEEAQRHLATAGVVDAQEQHDRLAGVAWSFAALDPGEGVQALPGEAFASRERKFGTVLWAANSS